MVKRPNPPIQAIEPRKWQSVEEIDRAIPKLTRRISEFESVDVLRDKSEKTSECDNAISNFKETIREVFGSASPEFNEHQDARMWAGPIYMGMSDREIDAAREAGRKKI